MDNRAFRMLGLAAGTMLTLSVLSGCGYEVTRIAGKVPVVVQRVPVRRVPPSRVVTVTKTRPVSVVGNVWVENRGADFTVNIKMKNISIRPVRRVYVKFELFDSRGKKIKKVHPSKNKKEKPETFIYVMEGETFSPDQEKFRAWFLPVVDRRPVRVQAHIISVVYEDGSRWNDGSEDYD